MKADHYHLPEEGLREEISLPLPLPVVVEDLEGVDLVLELLGQLVVQPLRLHEVPHRDRPNYKLLMDIWVLASKVVNEIITLTKLSG